MRLNFFSKCSKFYMDSKNALKYPQKFFRFEDKCIGIGFCKFSVLWRKHILPADNGLTYSFKISDLTKKNLFELYLCQHNKIGRKSSTFLEFSSVWDPLTCWLLKLVLEKDLLCIQVSTFFAVNKIRNS